MRPVHLVKPSGGPFVEPICGAWGSMADHWTDDAAGVTCGACLDLLRGLPHADVGPRVSASPAHVVAGGT